MATILPIVVLVCEQGSRRIIEYVLFSNGGAIHFFGRCVISKNTGPGFTWFQTESVWMVKMLPYRLFQCSTPLWGIWLLQGCYIIYIGSPSERTEEKLRSQWRPLPTSISKKETNATLIPVIVLPAYRSTGISKYWPWGSYMYQHLTRNKR